MKSPRLPAVQGSVSTARKFVTSAVTGVPRDVSDALTVIASELASNCVRHGASAFQVKVEQYEDRILIEVEDDGDGEPVMRSPEPTDTSGRGLLITGALADAWGVRRPGSTGKTVWAVVTLPVSDPLTAAERAAVRDAPVRSEPCSGRVLFAVRRLFDLRALTLRAFAVRTETAFF
jgi:anti-sigma regulatory factor (Ser/Thr protein kinase)